MTMTFSNDLAARAAASPDPGPPLRVALFSGNYNYVMDGPVRALNMLVGHLLERGHQALVFAPTVRAPAFAHVGELVSIPSIALPGSRREYRLGLGLWGAARKRLKAFAPDIIHIAAPDLTGYMALRYAEKNGVTPVASFHTRFDTYPRYYGARWAEQYLTRYMRNFYGRCRHVYAPSPSMAEELARDGIGRDIRLWTRGVDHGLFNPNRRDMAWRRAQGVDDEAVLVAFVGRVVLEKGIDVFADAVLAAQKRNPSVKALVVGDGPERARFQTRLPDAAFAGYLDGEALARAYASADIFFNPSVTETFGNVTLEAMASGLPAVCAAASGSVSLVADGECGFLCPPEAGAEGYAERLLALADDPEKRRSFARRALERARAYSWPAVLDGLIAHYRDAVGDRPARRLQAAACLARAAADA
ncbi:glycosyltransferase family 4 protein [Amphiplicatus metriothermophilus]|uniref:Glycosyltransferase involved in cell wall bisynthesis n=1 Tax=Amphiplicatus metriothermophilus TaxID=1519374 RepID=A0A239PJJ7_9PROT|nr:glycosyltransferase family 1 protein [Amphiplicatus metriothermophilus]MBB5517698.1 glycosyltransferase involved in cell wall biosynthesis [Amphiplicatus metriothermophilus]SNT67968.1 Glycosyltransferase involved in cell wall bisynthesis [Amphiplicatus metriothermophilus]